MTDFMTLSQYVFNYMEIQGKDEMGVAAEMVRHWCAYDIAIMYQD